MLISGGRTGAYAMLQLLGHCSLSHVFWSLVRGLIAQKCSFWLALIIWG